MQLMKNVGEAAKGVLDELYQFGKGLVQSVKKGRFPIAGAVD